MNLRYRRHVEEHELQSAELAEQLRRSEEITQEANATAQVSRAGRSAGAGADRGARAAARGGGGGGGGGGGAQGRRRRTRAVRAAAGAQEKGREVAAAAAATTPETAAEGTSAGKDAECFGVFCLTYDISKVRGTRRRKGGRGRRSSPRAG